MTSFFVSACFCMFLNEGTILFPTLPNCYLYIDVYLQFIHIFHIRLFDTKKTMKIFATTSFIRSMIRHTKYYCVPSLLHFHYFIFHQSSTFLQGIDKFFLVTIQHSVLCFSMAACGTKTRTFDPQDKVHPFLAATPILDPNDII